MASKSEQRSAAYTATSDWASSLAALFLTALLWGVGYIHVPPALGTGLLVVAGLVVALFCVWTRRWLCVAIGCLSIAAIAAFAIDVLVLERNVLLVSSRAEFGQQAPRELRVLDFNVLHGYSHFPEQELRANRIVAAIADLDPDVIILQEAWRTRQHGDFVQRLGETLGMDTAYARANGNLERIGFEEGEAILSRYPIVQAIRMQLEPRKPFFERRVALVGVLDLGGGETFLVAGTHLDHRRLEIATAQAQHLAGRLQELPVSLVAGDFNAPSGGAALSAFEDLGFVDLMPGGIDHVLLSSSSPWRSAATTWTLEPENGEGLAGTQIELSDHPAILVELERADDPT